MFAETIVFPQTREYTKRTIIIIFYMEENTMDKFIPIDKQSKKKQKEFWSWEHIVLLLGRLSQDHSLLRSLLWK